MSEDAPLARHPYDVGGAGPEAERDVAPTGAIRGFVVLSGAGSLVYVDDHTGKTITLTGLSSSAGDLEPTAGPLCIRSINGTGNANPSAALTLRCVW